jgi:hypothetical protein
MYVHTYLHTYIHTYVCVCMYIGCRRGPRTNGPGEICSRLPCCFSPHTLGVHVCMYMYMYTCYVLNKHTCIHMAEAVCVCVCVCVCVWVSVCSLLR